MHFFKLIVSEIGGIGIYGIVSICLFFAVFTGSIIWAMTRKKPFLNNMSGLPLEDGSISNKKGASHE